MPQAKPNEREKKHDSSTQTAHKSESRKGWLASRLLRLCDIPLPG